MYLSGSIALVCGLLGLQKQGKRVEIPLLCAISVNVIKA
jgi:hypothetical protein